MFHLGTATSIEIQVETSYLKLECMFLVTKIRPKLPNSSGMNTPPYRVVGHVGCLPRRVRECAGAASRDVGAVMSASLILLILTAISSRSEFIGKIYSSSKVKHC